MKKAMRETPRNNARKGFAAIGICVLAAAILALTIRSFGFQLAIVRSGAMADTLRAGDVVLISRSAQPETGRIVFASAINGDVFRRVIGEPGDAVSVEGGQVYRNGAPLYEPYALNAPAAADLSVELSAGVYLLMPDDRGAPSAMVEAGGIAGVAVAVLWPLSRASFL